METIFNRSNFDAEEINLSSHNLLRWIKDSNLNYLSCNEVLSELLGIESPAQLKGKNDFHLSWRKQADFYRKCDHFTLSKEASYYGIEEVQYHKIKAHVFVNKHPLFNRLGKCIGVIATGIMIDNSILAINNTKYDIKKGLLYLGEEFNNAHLTRRELSVLKWVLLGYTAKRTARVLNLSPRSVEIYIETLKQKLQCSTKNEIIAKATELGIASTVSNISAFIEDVA